MLMQTSPHSELSLHDNRLSEMLSEWLSRVVLSSALPRALVQSLRGQVCKDRPLALWGPQVKVLRGVAGLGA